MFEKDLRMDFLLDFYGDVLPERARDIMKQYYEDDLSLSEIAASASITRQGVRHTIKKAEEELLNLEAHLHLAERFTSLAQIAEQIKKEVMILSENESMDIKARAQTISECVRKIEAEL